MEQKNRLLISIAVIALMVIALFTSFGRSLFILNPPSVELPSMDSSTGLGNVSSTPENSSQYQKVEVTPQTVQSVIATLERTDSYFRELTIETFWNEGGSSTLVQSWIDGDWSLSRRVLPSGVIRHDLVGSNTLYYWYDGSRQYMSAPADGLSSDLSQRLPTYETVLELDPATITSAGYELRGELPCVYVEVTQEEFSMVERYWVSVDTGLLVSAETELDGQMTYRMTAYAPITAPCPATASFALPDGTTLHSIS